MIDIARARHPKETIYFTLAAALGGLIWLILIIESFGAILLLALFLGILAYITGAFMRASVLGNCVRVSERQFPQIHQMTLDASGKLGLRTPPATFIVNGNGMMNAYAVKLLSNHHVMLYSGIVDAALKRNADKELAFIVAHEVAHHAAGHTSGWKHVIILPAFFLRSLSSAYSRACEYTADALGLAVVEDRTACAKALVMLAHGSTALGDQVDLNEFLTQERDIPAIPAFINEISASHPRTTRRIAALASIPLTSAVPPPMSFVPPAAFPR